MVLERLPTPSAAVAKTPTDWSLPNWDSFIERRGLSFNLYRAHPCSCRNKRTSQPDYVCPLCLNRGDTLEFISEVPALVNTATQRTGLETSGIWEFGEATLTFKRDVEVDEGDALIYNNYKNRKAEVLRASGATDRLKFNFVEEVLRISYLAAEDISRARDLDERIRGSEATTAEKEERAILVRDLEIMLEEKTDFKLVRAGNRSFIQYLSAKKPPLEAAVSILYLHHPEFVVVDLPMDDIDVDVKIVQHRKVKRRDLMKDDESITPSASPEKP